MKYSDYHIWNNFQHFLKDIFLIKLDHIAYDTLLRSFSSRIQSYDSKLKAITLSVMKFEETQLYNHKDSTSNFKRHRIVKNRAIIHSTIKSDAHFEI